MQASSRFLNYALTGTFFLVTQILFLVIYNEHVTLDAWNNWVKDLNLYTQLPQVIQHSAETLLATLGVISIFLIGSLLEFMGSYFFISERNIFIHHLKRNNDWLEEIFSKSIHSLENSYNYLKNETEGFIWNPLKLFDIIKKHGAYSNLQAYMFSYIQVNPGIPVTNQLHDHRNLWRISRAITNTVVLLVVEMLILWTHISLFGIQVPVFVILIVLFPLSFYITVHAYNRMCYSLFSLTYAFYKKAD
ncbi:MAG: hypothetical protein OEY89_10085 [Gammaproteobacteria bacterium]|nr:hypothetical protein [Gammaproteobacteria bacterium]